MTATIKILMVLTSHGAMGDTGKPTGVWFEEVATPYYAFVDAGAQVDVVSIQGGKVPIDPRSLKPAGENGATVDRFLKDASAMRKIEVSLKIDQVTGSGLRRRFPCPAATVRCGTCPRARFSAICSRRMAERQGRRGRVPRSRRPGERKGRDGSPNRCGASCQWFHG
jgi:hypothetical protein